jgi:CubicO group peptidase (beta-lactamase class C family)
MVAQVLSAHANSRRIFQLRDRLHCTPARKDFDQFEVLVDGEPQSLAHSACRTKHAAKAPALDISKFDPSNIAQCKALGNPGTSGSLSNDARWYAADLPSANGFGNARALAHLYDLLLRPAPDGRVLVSNEAIAEAARCRFEGVDLVKGCFTRWSAGFWLNPGENLYGPNPEAFGFSGWGGSFGLVDPVADIAASYTMNRMSDQFELNPRRRGLINAVFKAGC